MDILYLFIGVFTLGLIGGRPGKQSNRRDSCLGKYSETVRPHARRDRSRPQSGSVPCGGYRLNHDTRSAGAVRSPTETLDAAIPRLLRRRSPRSSRPNLRLTPIRERTCTGRTRSIPNRWVSAATPPHGIRHHAPTRPTTSNDTHVHVGSHTVADCLPDQNGTKPASHCRVDQAMLTGASPTRGRHPTRKIRLLTESQPPEIRNKIQNSRITDCGHFPNSELKFGILRIPMGV